MIVSAAYHAALTDVAGPRLRDIATYWVSESGRREVEAAGDAAYKALERLSPAERALCFFDAIRLLHFHMARGRPSGVKWPDVPLTSIDESKFLPRADVPSIDLSEGIFNLMIEFSKKELAFTEAMLYELLILMRDRDGSYGVFCVPLLDHLERAAAGETTAEFRRELRSTAEWLRANPAGHEDDYWGRFRTAAERRLPALVR